MQIEHTCRWSIHADGAPMQMEHPCRWSTHADGAPMQMEHPYKKNTKHIIQSTYADKAPMKIEHLCRKSNHPECKRSTDAERAPMNKVHPSRCKWSTFFHAYRAPMQNKYSSRFNGNDSTATAIQRGQLYNVYIKPLQILYYYAESKICNA